MDFSAAALFVIGSILFFSEATTYAGTWLFLVDSVLFGLRPSIKLYREAAYIRRFDLGPVCVPNSALADNVMTNFSRMTYRRTSWIYGLEYGAPPGNLEQIRDNVEKRLKNDDRICSPPEASLCVRIKSFGENSINLMIYCFTKTTIWREWPKTKEDFALAMTRLSKMPVRG